MSQFKKKRRGEKGRQRLLIHNHHAQHAYFGKTKNKDGYGN